MTETMEVPQGRFELARWRTRTRSPLRAWDAADELLLRHVAEAHAEVGRTVVVNDAFGALAVGLHERAPVSVGDSWTGFAAARRNLEANGLSADGVVQRSALDPQGNDGELPADLVIIKVPKTAALLDDELRRLRPLLGPATTVVGAGMAKHIHTSTVELFERLVGPTTTSLARKKARLIHAEVDLSCDAGPTPFPEQHRLPSGERVVSHANVFSRGRLDQGTALFVDHLPDEVGQRVVDVGCGSGAIALRVASAHPAADLVLRDDSFHAVASATETLAMAGFEADIAAGDGVADLDDASVDTVVSNPPFHDDHAVGDDVAWSFFTGAHRVLRPGGELRIVANRHLAHHSRLNKIFGNVDVVASNRKFVILSSRRR